LGGWCHNLIVALKTLAFAAFVVAGWLVPPIDCCFKKHLLLLPFLPPVGWLVPPVDYCFQK